ncbi:hypothetical protein [Luteolibacter soli]|uniref:Uncharacterized protein n=1 Tax=Luteolibacter soli TaxID=3135280 RepID=A0ABU9AYH2_9BACT
MIQGINAWSCLATMAVLSLSACTGLSPEKEAVITKARLIRDFPVSRATLLASLGIEKPIGQRSEGSIGRSWASHMETWQHATGLTITAYDHEFVPAIDRKSIDDILNGRLSAADRDSIDDIINGRPQKPVAFTRQPAAAVTLKSFDGFSVKDGRKVLFQAGERAPDSQE